MNSADIVTRVMAAESCTIIGALIIIALFAPFFAPYSPNYIDLAQRLTKPDGHHLLGRDNLGQGIDIEILPDSSCLLVI